MTVDAFPRSLGQFWVLRRSKTPKKWPLCPYFDTQEAVLGDCSFGGTNRHQIQTFHLSRKVDRHGFSTSTLGLNLDFGKGFKTSSKVARHIQFLARRIDTQRPKLHPLCGIWIWNFLQVGPLICNNFFPASKENFKKHFWLLSKWPNEGEQPPTKSMLIFAFF